MQDRPSLGELLEAVRHFLENDVVPALQGHKQFHARVATNVLAIAQRELAHEDGQMRTEWRRLAELLGGDPHPPAERSAARALLRKHTSELCERIRQGDADRGPFADAVRDHVRQTVIEKLIVANPKFVPHEPGQD